MRKEVMLAVGVAALASISMAVGGYEAPEPKRLTLAECRANRPTVTANELQQVSTPAQLESEEDAAGLDFTDEESQILLKLAMAEAGDQGVIGKALVINVVKNRVESEDFPNSIEEVIFEPKQFSPIEDGRYDKAVPDAECEDALEMVLNYWDGANGALYFEADWNENTWHRENLTQLFQYGDLIFYK